MTDLAISDFTAGEHYQVVVGGAEVTLRLERVDPLPGAVREAGGFRLEFLGPAEPMLTQATYALRGAGDSRDIFIVPIGRDPAGIRYEAIFN